MCSLLVLKAGEAHWGGSVHWRSSFSREPAGARAPGFSSSSWSQRSAGSLGFLTAWLLTSRGYYSKRMNLSVQALVCLPLHHAAHVPLTKASHVAESGPRRDGTPLGVNSRKHGSSSIQSLAGGSPAHGDLPSSRAAKLWDLSLPKLICSNPGASTPLQALCSLILCNANGLPALGNMALCRGLGGQDLNPNVSGFNCVTVTSSNVDRGTVLEGECSVLSRGA